MRSFPAILAAAILLAGQVHSLAAELAPPPRILGDKEPPNDWKLADLNALLPNPKDPGPAAILAWESLNYNGVMGRVERCLVLKRCDEPKDGKPWVLVYCWRQPENPDRPWEVWAVSPAGLKPGEPDEILGVEFYKQAPTDDEIAAFLKKHFWQALSTPGEVHKAHWHTGKPAMVKYTPTLVDGGISHTSWKKYFDREVPAKLFPEMRPLMVELKGK
jgi:hypothetical protein